MGQWPRIWHSPWKWCPIAEAPSILRTLWWVLLLAFSFSGYVILYCAFLTNSLLSPQKTVDKGWGDYVRGTQQDCVDFVYFLFNALHNELKVCLGDAVLCNWLVFSSYICHFFLFLFFWQERLQAWTNLTDNTILSLSQNLRRKRKYASVMTTLFMMQILTIVSCSSCSYFSVSSEDCFYLSLDIPHTPASAVQVWIDHLIVFYQF